MPERVQRATRHVDKSESFGLCRALGLTINRRRGALGGRSRQALRQRARAGAGQGDVLRAGRAGARWRALGAAPAGHRVLLSPPSLLAAAACNCLSIVCRHQYGFKRRHDWHTRNRQDRQATQQLLHTDNCPSRGA